MEEVKQSLEPPRGEHALASGSRGWRREGLRVLAFRSPRWEGLDGRPGTVAGIVLATYGVNFFLQRALIDGPALPRWSGLLNGWAAIALMAWLCWVVARSGTERAATPGPASAPSSTPTPSPTAGTLLTLLSAAHLMLSTAASTAVLLASRFILPLDDWDGLLSWAIWWLPLLWGGLASLALLWRVAGTGGARLVALLLVPASLAVSAWLQPAVLWHPERAADDDRYTGLPLSEDVLAAQPRLLAEALDALQPPQPGRINVYAATYAPYASEDVFLRESAVVAKTLGERFGATGRTVQLVTNPATTTALPWALHANLRATLQRMATLMDRDRDVLFLHLTSHGAADGELAAYAWPLDTALLTPALLRQWLDEAGIRWRVISVSACYSGSWIEPLAGDGTLVMTAADATHTSYGCGTRSPLTFFGQAMYVDALRSTWSFPAAHAQARQLIEVREREAGKRDGYSNPQISEGAGIKERLGRLEAQQRGW